MAFTDEDSRTLVALLTKLREHGWPIPQDAFYALCESFITAPVELALMRDGEGEDELFLTHREDAYFKGWHLPGSIMRPGERAEDALARMVKDEVGDVGDAPVLFRTYDRMMGSGEGASPRGQEVARVFRARLGIKDSIREHEGARFVPLSEAEAMVIPLHKPLIRHLRAAYARA